MNMNKIPEGLKIFNDVRLKKLKENTSRSTKKHVEQENKTPHTTPDVLQNTCFYCAKIFINSYYLLKHILRRHSDELVNFHRKYSQSDPCDLKNLFTFLESEFSGLKNEIFVVKQAIFKCEEDKFPVRSKEPIKNSNLTPEMLRALTAEKLSKYNIFSDTSRLSNSVYEEKLRLVNTKKECLKMSYHNFSEVHNSVNISANQRVLTKLKPKQKQKLRFSEPLILNQDISSNLLSNKADFLNKSCPVLKEEINYSDIEKPFVSNKPAVAVPKSEGFMFQDNTGSGDCCDQFQEDYRNHVKEMFDNIEGKRFHTSSPVTDVNAFKKSRNTFSQNSSFVESNELSSEGKNRRYSVPAEVASDILLDDDDTTLNKTYVKYYKDEADVLEKIEDEEESIKSLSSLEDDSFANNPIK